MHFYEKLCSLFSADDYHLRKTNWCGEAAETLDDLDLTLAACQLRDGDHLLLEEGRLPPKAHIIYIILNFS